LCLLPCVFSPHPVYLWLTLHATHRPLAAAAVGTADKGAAFVLRLAELLKVRLMHTGHSRRRGRAVP
jgi:hypothetical protein